MVDLFLLLLTNKHIRLSFTIANLFYWLFCGNVQAQRTVVVDVLADPYHKVVIAGKQYKANRFHRFLWGTNYRPEWTTPVKVPVFNIDSIYGGLKPVKQGGGHETNTLRLQTKDGNEFVLRLIDKNFGAALPEIVQGTLLEEVVKDQVPVAHPFAPLVVPVLAEAAGLYHTNPLIVFVPESKTLGDYNTIFGNTLCLFEERPDDNEEVNANFGNARKVIGTDNMYEKIRSGNDQTVDQKLFVKARLFDMFLGDWGRHEDQWRWGKFDKEDITIYKPIPRDRDQTFTQFQGLIPKIILAQDALSHLQSFDYTIQDINKYNFAARFIDRQLTNEATRDVWVTAAKALQQSLTDAIIEKAIHQLPPEMFKLSGSSIIDKLKSRRDHLTDFANQYYYFLSKEVEIAGTTENELFEVTRISDNETKVEVYGKTKKEVRSHSIYSRTFLNKETDEIRLYGLGGHDTYHITGRVKRSIKLRIIGGTAKDSIIDESSVGGISHKTAVYDNPGNDILPSSETRVHLSRDTTINQYNYKGFKYDKNGMIISGGVNTEKGVFLTSGYQFQKQHWRKTPFAWQQALKVNYSITQKSLGVEYGGIFNQVIGKWNFVYNTGYYPTYTINFYGIGNETKLTSKYSSYNEIRKKDFFADAGLNHPLGKKGTIGITLFYQDFKFLNDQDHYAGKILSATDPHLFNWKQFGIAQINYRYDNINDEVLPTKGVQFLSSIAHTVNLKDTHTSNTRYAADLGIYIPLSKRFTFMSRSGGSTVTGNPEFHQLAWIGGGDNLRGYYKYRFFGKTAFYNNDELLWATNSRNFLFNGKVGVLGLFDNGRVWQPGESSDKWHTGYGGGIMLAPFNKISVVVTYAVSEEANRFNLRFGKYF